MANNTKKLKLAASLFSRLVPKLSSLFITFFLSITISFFLLRILPGSPFSAEKVLPQEIIQKMETKYGLNKPVFEQYLSYMSGVLTRGDLGPSLKYPNRNVIDILPRAFGVSFVIGCGAFSLALILGLSLAFLAVYFEDITWVKAWINSFTSMSLSLPNFVFAGIFVWFFGLQLDILPVALLEGPEYFVLPIISLAFLPTAYISKISYESLSANINTKYMDAALAKGLSKSQAILRHASKNSILPVITVLGPMFAILITGSFVIEHIFALPGMGKYFITAFINRDYFLVTGVIIIFASLLLVVNALIDILVSIIDPRA